MKANFVAKFVKVLCREKFGLYNDIFLSLYNIYEDSQYIVIAIANVNNYVVMVIYYSY